MEARFILLHPDDPGEILWATALIRCLKTQVEEAQVYSVVNESHRWLLENNPFLDEVFTFRENPKELLETLKDFLPDYLIDLDGTRGVRRFKNRLKVLDFTINRKHPDEPWLKRALATCHLFDVEDDGKGMQLEANAAYREILPGDFLGGYVVLALNDSTPGRSMSDEEIIEMVVMTEKPIVITGDAKDRNLADRIGQSTGCAVFPTCGDLNPAEMLSVLGHASGALVFDPFWSLAANALGTGARLVSAATDSASIREMALWARSRFHKKP